MILNFIKDIKANFSAQPLTIETDDVAKNIIDQYNQLQLGHEAFSEKVNIGNDSLKKYFATVESGKASFIGYQKYVETTNKSIGKLGIATKAVSVGTKLLGVAMSALTSIGISLVISAIVTGIDHLIRKDEILRSVEYYDAILPGLGVNIHLNTEATKEVMNAADAVIVAVGAQDIVLPINGTDSANVVSSWDVLAGKVEVSGHCAVIGGGLVGTETAEYLVEKGCKVSVIEMMDKIANGESSTILPIIMADFAKNDVKQYVNTKVNSIENDGKQILATDTKEEKDITIDCDMVVMAVGSKKNVFDVEGVTTPVVYAGDCSGERTASIAEAIRTGYKAANEI